MRCVSFHTHHPWILSVVFVCFTFFTNPSPGLVHVHAVAQDGTGDCSFWYARGRYFSVRTKISLFFLSCLVLTDYYQTALLRKSYCHARATEPIFILPAKFRSQKGPKFRTIRQLGIPLQAKQFRTDCLLFEAELFFFVLFPIGASSTSFSSNFVNHEFGWPGSGWIFQWIKWKKS